MHFSAVLTGFDVFGECVAFHHRNGPDRPLECASCRRLVFVKANGAKRKYCSLACMVSRDQTGERNPNWRGGKSLNYGPDWKQTKKEVRDRDGLCRECGKTPEDNGRALDVHHIEPFRFSGDNSPENLVALCRSCHMRANDHGRKGSAEYLRKQGQMKPLTRRQIRRFQTKLRKFEATKKRRGLQARAFDLHAEGRSLRQIARELGVSHQTVANWLSGDVRRLVS